MATIRVSYDGLPAIGDQFAKLANTLKGISREYLVITGALDWDVKEKKEISGRMRRSSQLLMGHCDTCLQMKEYLHFCHHQYKVLDKELVQDRSSGGLSGVFGAIAAWFQDFFFGKEKECRVIPPIEDTQFVTISYDLSLSGDLESKVGKRVANFNSGSYDDPDGNPYECVWYVRGRAKELWGIDTKIRGDAKTWFTSAQKPENNMSTGRMIREHSIACFSGSEYGHVVYIEKVEGDTVYFTEANNDLTDSSGKCVLCDGKMSPSDGVLKSLKISEFEKRNGLKFDGCIYLDYPKEEKNAIVSVF